MPCLIAEKSGVPANEIWRGRKVCTAQLNFTPGVKTSNLNDTDELSFKLCDFSCQQDVHVRAHGRWAQLCIGVLQQLGGPVDTMQ